MNSLMIEARAQLYRNEIKTYEDTIEKTKRLL
jgi:hypothetical protein